MATICPECGAEVQGRTEGARGGIKTFCCPEHSVAFERRQMTQGRAIILMAKAWRVSRNRREDREIGRVALAELCAILDGFIAEDFAAGRPRATEYAAARLARGYRYVDRQAKARN